MKNENPVRLLCMSGAGRSGSTLFELMAMTSYEDLVTVGELNHLWIRGVAANEPCGCGQPFLECPFWDQVGEIGFGGWHSKNALRARQMHDSVSSYRNAPQLTFPNRKWRIRPEMDEYANQMDILYRSIAAASNQSHILDASKWPPHAAVASLLAQSPDFEFTFIHMVRDPAAFARSMRAIKPRLTKDDGEVVYMDRLSTMRAAAFWLTVNLHTELLVSQSGLNSIKIIYEELVENPVEVLTSIGRELNLQLTAADLSSLFTKTNDSTWTFQRLKNHAIPGNPMRHGDPTVRVRPVTFDESTTSLTDGFSKLLTEPIWKRYRS